jgi:hypothetical protein
MSVTFKKESDNFFVVNVEGKLSFDDQKNVEMRARHEIDCDKKAKLLVLAENFTGWEKEGDWGDLTFMHEYDPYITKIAVVAQEERKDKILMYIGAGRRQASVEFFFPDEEQDAREWLQEED